MTTLNPIKIGSAWSQSIQLSDPSKNIESISDGTPCVVSLTNHGFSNGDNITIAGNKNGDTTNGGTGRWIVANATSNTFELQGSTATGFGTLYGGIVAKAYDATGGTITFAAVGATLAAGDSLFTSSAIGTTVSFQPTFAWGDATVSPTSGQPIGYFTLSLDAAEVWTITPAWYYGRIYFNDSINIPQEPLEVKVEVSY